MIPDAEITEAADRRWTFDLIDRLTDPTLPEEELDDLIESLQTVSDPRSIGPLEGILTSPRRPERIREAAGEILREMNHLRLSPQPERVRQWWREGDPVLKKHALAVSKRGCAPEIVLQAASDPNHSMHADAVGMLMFCFERPEHQEIKIRGLSHPDAKVRAAAADVLLWDEPVQAELPLIHATRDPSVEVAIEAANTLQYYPTHQVIRCLNDLSTHSDKSIQEQALGSIDEIRSAVLCSLYRNGSRAADHLRRWLTPVWEILNFSEEDLSPEQEDLATPSRAEPEPIDVDTTLGDLDDPDTSPLVWNRVFWSMTWEGCNPRDRQRLRPMLLNHPDPIVREGAAKVFAAWRDLSALLDLLQDDDFCVRKAAMYRLSALPPSPSLAEIAWTYLERGDIYGAHEGETLHAFVGHAEPSLAIARLAPLVADPERSEGLRNSAVYDLRRLQARSAIQGLLLLLQEPPPMTWALHVALLEAAVELNLKLPDLRALWQVDHLHVQEALGRCRR